MKKQDFWGMGNGVYLILIPLVIIGACTYWYFNLPLEGFCQAENRRLTDQERVEKVVTEVLKNYPQSYHREVWQGEPSEHDFADGEWLLPSGKYDGGGKSMKKPSYPILYKDIREFFELNPNCCYLTQSYHSKTSAEYGDTVSDWDRKTGKKAIIVVVKWKLRYMDSDGLAQAKEYEWGLTEDNCGNIVHEYED